LNTGRLHALRLTEAELQTYYRSYDQVNPDYLPPRDIDEYRNLQNFGLSGRDPSRVGGETPNLHPPGN
jgi:hypothetical protein